VDEGTDFYIQRLSALLAEPEADFPDVKLPDIPFSKREIRNILQGVVEELKKVTIK
jgi:hypothetical protein